MSRKAKASLPARVGSLLLTATISSDICLFGRPPGLPLTRKGYCFELSIRAATVLGGNGQNSQALRVFKPALLCLASRAMIPWARRMETLCRVLARDTSSELTTMLRRVFKFLDIKAFARIGWLLGNGAVMGTRRY
jgi:hypothetical protein